MRKAVLPLIALTLAVIIPISTSFTIKMVKAENSENTDYRIEYVNHTIEVMYNGYVFINDTIRIVGNASDSTVTLDRFLIGFPYKYGSYILRCIAYDTSKIFNVTLNVPFENRIGFYAAEVRFPQPLDLSNGTIHEFTVAFILSNDLLKQDSTDTSLFTLDYPAYPSLTTLVDNCSVTIALPEDVMNVMIAKDDGAINASAYWKEKLPAFTYSAANVTFSLTSDKIRIVDIKSLEREVRINEMGEIEGSDSYYITSKASKEIIATEIILPPNASNPSAQDQMGRRMQDPRQIDETTNRYTVTFELPLESYKSTRFTVKYHLPGQIYINSQEGSNNFNINPLIFQYLNYYIEQVSIAILLPEGARVLNPEKTLIGSDYSLTRSAFQETITINKQGVNGLENIILQESALRVTYEYNSLWLSFRPTLWMWALTVVGLVVAVVLKRPKALPKVAVPEVAMRLRPEFIKSFVDSYEEKRKITSEITLLETRVRKGKIPRRRYKVQRKTLETRLNTLSRSLAELKEKMRAAGGLYADLMRQLEIAETEINEVESNIKSIEARYSRGELSLEAYRKLLSDYQRRKEKANTTVGGILLRLREEIR
jgi:hypothetical protein